jgi:hypothetical protein
MMQGVFVCGNRYSILPALSLDGMIATTVIEGSVMRPLFLEFLEKQVVSLTLLCVLVTLQLDILMSAATHEPISG